MMSDVRIDEMCSLLYPTLFPRRQSALIRLSFRCEQCGAEHMTERRYTSIRRFLDRSARNLGVPYLRCPCCKHRSLRLVGYPELIRREA